MNNPQQQPTCQDRIDSHLESRLSDLRILFHGPTIDDVQLIDDGTLDTVIEVYEQQYRFSDTSAYRGYQIEDEDYVIQSPAFKGYFCYQNRKEFNFVDIDSMTNAIIQDMKANEFYPNVWFISDHGNETLLSINTETGEWISIENNPGLDLAEFWDSSECDSIREEIQEQFYEYGLSFDYVAPHTFEDQEHGYFQWCLSTGGPGDEFRFYVDLDETCYKIEYWFLDWFDGASITLHSGGHGKPDTNAQLMLEIFEHFKECGSCFFVTEAKR